jgi:disulfide bond formation protein DsbB
MCWQKINAHFTANAIWFLLALGMMLMVASAYVLENYFGAIPCQMCLWQRYVHWAVLGLAGVGCLLPFTKLRKALVGLVAVAAAVGLYVAGWQTLAQLHVLPWPPSCTGDYMALSSAEDLLASLNQNRTIPCDKEGFKLFGLTLAMWNIPVMLAVMVWAKIAMGKK